MAELKEARVPDIGDYDDVPVIELLVAVGDTVKQDQGLVTLESDKATMEVPAPFAGVVRELKVKIGDKLSEGSVVAMIEPAEAGAAPPRRQAAERRRAPSPLRPQRQRRRRRDRAPGSNRSPCRSSPTASRSSLDRSARRPRSTAARHRPGSRAAAHAAGGVRRRRADAGQGAVCQPGGAPVRARTRRRPVAGAGQRTRRPHQQGRRAEVREVGAGRRRRRRAGAGGGGGGLNLLPWPKVDFAKFGEIETKPLSRIQKLSGANLARNWAMIPHVTQHDDADITDLEALRVALNKENEKSRHQAHDARLPDEGRRSRRCRSTRPSTPRSTRAART